MHKSKDNLSKKILSLYDNTKRTLPWRISQKFAKNQYYRILSEFMLQQTQVKTVVPYFKNFIKEVPNLTALSNKKGRRVLKLWEGLGYYRRARNLHKTAKILIKKYNGKLPKKLEEIKTLPGVGEYTARALLALVYNQSYIPFDGNVRRVFSRLFNLNIEKNEKKIKKIISKQFYTDRNGDLAEALMEFGAIICKPHDPVCNICNLKANCYFFKNQISVSTHKKHKEKEEKYNIYCYLKKQKKEIALSKNKNLSFLSDFNIPETQVATKKNQKNNGWIYLCNYKNNISNTRMNINLFYKFIKNKPKKYTWYSIDKPNIEFIPSFTKKIFKKISTIYN